jgi:prepilin-type N-terminal cleavage/methylation domain-containing protein
MKPNFPSRVADSQVRPVRHRGFTLPEMMVSVAVGSLILAAMAMVFMTSARSFAAMANYVDMDASSRNTLDQMTRDIRQAGDLVQFSPTYLKFTTLGQTNSFLIYSWNAGTGCLTGWETGNSLTNVLLSGCDQLTFSMYDSSFLATTNISLAKGICVNWKCSRTILGNKTTTEDMQQALIVMRNKPL